jgi:hypothetical protein
MQIEFKSSLFIVDEGSHGLIWVGTYETQACLLQAQTLNGDYVIMETIRITEVVPG